ncbi:tRNA dihydrouridine synthase [Levilactobacillus parabrevis]|uniref:tRNA-dihydrouridine synthase n=1 Tax=Levilactobacillus parabrevis ATCC 53295 TaxID=1267003 RepID=A0A0R1GZC5_9LACO|nr:tRNA-dihydrouridine synthase family protein [Levilactobacillus parabrevis]KRK39336.1 tRNA-dihydrouridine synthase [Levilactobacillus parabrevis ATCC 53295]KRO07237.1 tRNA-dihydrouridine synthase [Levilactobacillus parabrevis]MCT4487480.1 tRNA-dihydrouridine synthase family protein [Levilactobacillus parabrevis]MCT4490568.1 tRNA-dihydrouridine synthase family protein [Levilactobacillus parabrevis]
MSDSSSYWQNIADHAKAEDRPFFSLAPMEAVTNAIFRRVVARAAAPDVFFTEFTNAISVTHPKAKFTVAGRLYVAPEEAHMPVAQLWGNDEEAFARAAENVKERGYEAIDINMGCPDSTVIKNHGGSDLIRNFDSAAAVIAGAKTAGLPVSVKTRLGYSRLDEWRDWLTFLFKQDIPLLTIHLRTKKEMSRVPAHFELIDDIVKLRDEVAPHTLLQLNGDIENYQEGLALAKAHPGVDGIMIGRGIFTSPFAFEKTPQHHDVKELLGLLDYQLDLYDEFEQRFDTSRFASLKRFFKIYVRSEPNAASLRNAMMETHTTDEVRQLLADSEFTK